MYNRINQIIYNVNPEKEELLDFVSNSELGRLRGILTHDDNLYVWDAEKASHIEMVGSLRVFGTRLFVAKEMFDVDCIEDKLKLLANP